MLINKWLISDKLLPGSFGIKEYTGICLPVYSEAADISSLYITVQQLPDEISFALLFSEEHFNGNRENSSLIKKIIGLFFMPAYCLLNYQPVLFVQNKSGALNIFLDKLASECKEQGIRDIVVKEFETNNKGGAHSFVYSLNADHDFNLGVELKKWVNENLKGNTPPEINLLIPERQRDLIYSVSDFEKIKETEEYRIADTFYKKQQLVEESNHQLYLKAINEKNVRFYLSIQKEERAKGLKWYYYEYEILPTWYKQFGHIIKVIMGKRSFRSLFNDNVKKYKD